MQQRLCSLSGPSGSLISAGQYRQQARCICVQAQAERTLSGSTCSVSPHILLSEQATSSGYEHQHTSASWIGQLASQSCSGAVRAGFAASLALLAFCAPCHAELQTVSPSVATESAKALPQQKVEKEKVWLLFLGGAAALFGGTVLLENNEALFPAIARSNRALAASRKDSEEKAQEALQSISDERLENAVAAGLAEARQKNGSAQLPASGSIGHETSLSLPTPDSLEASESSAFEETYASTHQ